MCYSSHSSLLKLTGYGLLRNTSAYHVNQAQTLTLLRDFVERKFSKKVHSTEILNTHFLNNQTQSIWKRHEKKQ